jgi:hypothetical protein
VNPISDTSPLGTSGTIFILSKIPKEWLFAVLRSFHNWLMRGVSCAFLLTDAQLELTEAKLGIGVEHNL